MAKILFIDIEWRPATAYVWRVYDETISPDQLIDNGGMLCFCAHWEGSREYMFFSEWTDGREGMAKAAKTLLEEADLVIGYNHDKYDIPKITGEILLAGLNAPPPVATIDLYKAVRKMGFVMNKLAFIAPLLGIGKKIEVGGFNLWKAVMAGDEKARAKMEKYCIQDVKLLPKLYHKLKPFIRNHPFVGDRGACGACNSKVLHSRGYRRTKTYRIQRLQCQDCGSWRDGKREKISG